MRYFLVYFNFKSATKFSLQFFYVAALISVSSDPNYAFRRVGKFKKPKDMLKVHQEKGTWNPRQKIEKGYYYPDHN